jgi:hypothetical protein
MLYGIGLTAESVTDLADLTTSIPYPKSDPPWAETEELGDGTLRQVGFLRTVWHLAFLEADQRIQMRQYCPNASAEVYISTRMGDDTYAIFKTIMRWPRDNARTGWTPNVEIEYLLVEEEMIGS